MVSYEPATSGSATVTATKMSTTMSVTFSAPTKSGSSVVKGDTLSFVATLVVSPGGAPLSGMTVYFEDAGVTVGTYVTNASGQISATRVAPTTAQVGRGYNFYWSGDANYNGSAVGVAVTIEARVPKLTLGIPATVKAGDPIAWSGELSDPIVTTYKIPNKSIYLDESIDGTTFTSVSGPVTTGASGTFSGSYTAPAVARTYYYRSRFPGGSLPHHEMAISETSTVEVKEELSAWDKLKNKWNALPVWGKGLIIVAPIGAIVLATRKKKK